MEIIVLRQFRNLGNPGDLVTVKDGYAKNYLIPKGIAQYATKENLKNLEQGRDVIMQEHNSKLTIARQLQEKINGSVFTVIRSASDDHRLYGSVTTKDVISLIQAKVLELGLPQFQLERGSVQLGTGVKSLGIHEVKVVLYSDIFTKIKLNIGRSENEAEMNLKAEALAKEAEEKNAKKKKEEISNNEIPSENQQNISEETSV